MRMGQASVPVVIAIMIAMIVAPGPVFFLLLGRQMAEVAILVAAVFAGPLAVVDDFIVVPDVVVAVVRVVHAIGMMFARRADSGERYG